MLLDFFYPRVCSGCAQDLSLKKNIFLCWQCWKKIPLPKNICLSCGNYHAVTVFQCFLCKRSSFQQRRYIGKYENLLKKLLLEYKFANQAHYSYLFAALLYRIISKFPFPETVDYILPIPLSCKKRMKRGYNQSSLISYHLAKKMLAKHMDTNLLKIKNTKNQTELNLEERKSNLIGAFQLRCPEKLYRKNILLIDDIYTTGSTIEQATKTLRTTGKVNNVYVAVIATGEKQ